MSPLFIYLVKASATVFILWAFYTLCLRRMTFHRLNRYFFLTGILVSLLWPALPLTEWLSKAPQVNQVVVYIPVTAFVMQFKPEAPVFGLEMAFKIAYFAGVLFMLARLIIQIFSLRAIFKKSELRVINDVTVRVVNDKINPFSFFGYIFLNPSNHTTAELAAIILHEKVHETRTHSVDILLSELLKILLWFNPFSWLFCRAVKENIEFEVDRVLLHQGIDCKQYQYSLLQLSVIKNKNPITTHFNLSNLKTRIIMMNKNQSSKYGLATYALIIPLILVCMVFSYAFAQQKPPKADAVKKGIIIKQKIAEIPSKALIILDGKVIDKAKMDAVSPKDIYSINVIKGNEAKSIFGRKGKNGVVLITSKTKDSGKKSDLTLQIKDSTGKMRDVKPLIIIDGESVYNEALKDLQPDNIESFSVLKDENATRVYGDKGKNGVILVITKKNKNAIDGYTPSFSGNPNNSFYKRRTELFTYKTNPELFRINTDRAKMNTKGAGYITYQLRTEVSKRDLKDQIRVDSIMDIQNPNGLFSGRAKVDAYYYLDGKEADLKRVSDVVNSKNVEKFEVLEGEAAKAVIGNKAYKPVFKITTKK